MSALLPVKPFAWNQSNADLMTWEVGTSCAAGVPGELISGPRYWNCYVA